MKNEKICPETELRVLLPAGEIPSGATVAKRTGENRYTLSYDLMLYQEDALRKEGAQPVRVEGLFLVGERASITQVKPETMLHWIVTAEDFVETIQRSWEPEDQ
jgi:hypothetical protein